MIKGNHQKKYRIAFILLLILASYPFVVFAQELEWMQTYTGTGSDVAWEVIQTTDSGYAVMGSTHSDTTGPDAWLIKTDSSGDEEWNMTYGSPLGTTADYAYSIQQTSDGGYIFTGCTYSYGMGYGDVWLVKTLSDGTLDWHKTFGGTGYDLGSSVKQTSDGGYIIAGTTTSFGAGSFDIWLIKTDSSGNEVWNSTFGGASQDMGLGVVWTSDGYVVVGRTLSFSVGYPGDDLWLIKTDLNGNHVWNRTYGASNNDIGHHLKQTPDGGFIIAGQSTSLGNPYDAWLIKTDSEGYEEWSNTYGGSDHETANSVDLTSDGGYIFTGYGPNATGSDSIWLVKTDSDGNHEWNRTYIDDIRSEGHSVIAVDDGEYVVAGIKSTETSGYDIVLLKVGPGGEEIPTIPEAMDDIEEELSHKGTIKSLHAKLRNALKALEKGNMNAYENILQAFINHVTAQSGKKIPTKYAETLIDWAEAWIENPDLAI